MPNLPMHRQDIIDALTALITQLKSTNTKASLSVLAPRVPPITSPISCRESKDGFGLTDR